MALELLKGLSEQDLLEFTNDCVKYLSGASVPFISKYNERFGNSTMITPCRNLIIDLFQVTLRNSSKISGIDKFKNGLAQHGEVPEVLSAIIFGKR